MAMLQEELNQSNQGMIVLTLELESKSDETARINEELKKEIMERYRLGVNSYIVKPVDFDKFKTVSELGLCWLLLNAPPPNRSQVG